jgi:hypothetical protein
MAENDVFDVNYLMIKDRMQQAKKEGKQPRKLPDVDERPVVSDSTVSVEASPAGTEMSTTDVVADQQADMEPPHRPKAKREPVVMAKSTNVPKPSQGKKKEDVKLSQVKDIPLSLIRQVRMLPGLVDAANNTDAVTAFMAVTLGNYEDLTPEQLRLANAYAKASDASDPMLAMQKSITKATMQLRTLLDLNHEAELALSYLVFDRLGYRRGNPAKPGDVDFGEDGVEDVMRRLQMQSAQRIELAKRRDGRPIR